MPCKLNKRVKRRTHPINILEEWTSNSVLEVLFVKISPVDSLRVILWEVMNTVIKKLAVFTRAQESNVRSEIWFGVCLIRGSSEEGDVAS